MKSRNRGNALLEVVGERFELLDLLGERADRGGAGVQAAVHGLLLLHHDRHAPRGKLLLLLERWTSCCAAISRSVSLHPSAQPITKNCDNVSNCSCDACTFDTSGTLFSTAEHVAFSSTSHFLPAGTVVSARQALEVRHHVVQ